MKDKIPPDQLVADAVVELRDIIDDLFLVANLLDRAGRQEHSKMARDLAVEARTLTVLVRAKKPL